MRRAVKIGHTYVGDRHPCFIIAEIGINHNGDISLAKKLIYAAFLSGCNAVKFQKRTIEVVYTPEELVEPRESPFGKTNGDLKRGLEFGFKEYRAIDEYCKKIGIMWFASCWDEGSVDFIEQFNPPCFKIASACLTNKNLLRHHKEKGKPIILSTGMSTMNQIKKAVEILGEDNMLIAHCTSTYPSKEEELNLKTIQTLKNEFDCPIGYSGHEVGIMPAIAAATLGACFVERHITLDRAMWGSDQAASVEPQGVERIVTYIRTAERSMGNGIKKVYDSEHPIIKKLRRVKDF